jgi:hypothetical protein
MGKNQMNERIKELAVQAKVTGYFAADTEYATPIPLSNELQKFAELIVRECLEIAIEEELHAPFEGPVETKIRQHFGVE